MNFTNFQVISKWLKPQFTVNRQTHFKIKKNTKSKSLKKINTIQIQIQEWSTIESKKKKPFYFSTCAREKNINQ